MSSRRTFRNRNLHGREDHGTAHSCLQSTVDFLQKTITKLTIDHQQKIDAANRQIEALKAMVAGLQKVVGDLQVAHKQLLDD